MVRHGVVNDNDELMKFWDNQKNMSYKLYPDKITLGSAKNVWWKCENGYPHSYFMSPRDRRRCSCPYCSGKLVLCGFNDVATKRPDLVKYFVNPQDATMFTCGSAQEVNLKCCHDGCTVHKKMKIATLTHQGFSCPIHSDGISYPEKLMRGVLSQLNFKYKSQVKFDWSKHIWTPLENKYADKVYDFVDVTRKIIIEVHGEQHYGEGFQSVGGRTLAQEQSNDGIKYEIAIQNGYKMIVVDCRQSSLEFIKNNILQSDLSIIYDLSNIDWNSAHKDALKSFVVQAADMWNQGFGLIPICDMLNISKNTARRYLLQATEIGMCCYTQEESNKRGHKRNSGSNNHKSEAVCLCNRRGEPIVVWDTQSDACKDLHISQGNLSQCCLRNGNRRYANGLIVCYLRDAILDGVITSERVLKIKRPVYTKAQIDNIIQQCIVYKNCVVQLDDNDCIISVWESPKIAADACNIWRSHIASCCLGVCVRAGGYRWLYLYDHQKTDGSIVSGAISRGIIAEDDAIKLINKTK